MSCYECKGELHCFTVENWNHPQSDLMKNKLDQWTGKLATYGYVPDTSWVLWDIKEEAKKIKLCYHSEKMALAFAIINSSPNDHIFITKNLRMCPDCHAATAAISVLENRDISIRDANRWHHFRHGTCSCNNFW